MKPEDIVYNLEQGNWSYESADVIHEAAVYIHTLAIENKELKYKLKRSEDDYKASTFHKNLLVKSIETLWARLKEKEIHLMKYGYEQWKKGFIGGGMPEGCSHGYGGLDE